MAMWWRQRLQVSLRRAVTERWTQVASYDLAIHSPDILPAMWTRLSKFLEPSEAEEEFVFGQLGTDFPDVFSKTGVFDGDFDVVLFCGGCHCGMGEFRRY